MKPKIAASDIWLRSQLIASVSLLLLLPACQNVPKYKKSSGKFDEWGGYQGKTFSPTDGTDTAIDLTAQTITIGKGAGSHTYPVTSDTRILHDGEDITLAQLPVNQQIKYTLSEDHTHLITVWYTSHSTATPTPAKQN